MFCANNNDNDKYNDETSHAAFINKFIFKKLVIVLITESIIAFKHNFTFSHYHHKCGMAIFRTVKS